MEQLRFSTETSHQFCTKPLVRRDTSPDENPGTAGLLHRPQGLRREDVRYGSLKRSSDVTALCVERTRSLELSHHGCHCGLEPTEGEIVEVRCGRKLVLAQHRTRKSVSSLVPFEAGLLDRRPTRVGEPQELRNLIECLAGGVVPRLPEEAIRTPLHRVEQ